MSAAQSLRRALQRQGLRSFEITPNSVEVLATPCDFYESLLTACRGARSRISLSALYWGTGALEQDLAAAVEGAMAARDAKVTVVLDAARARRADGAGRTSVSTLARVAGRGAAVRLFETPRLGGAALQRALDFAPRPLRGLVNEILGVHHVKVFAVDDAVVLSSANLSDEYFSTRRDRCVVVRDARVAAWHHDLVAILADADADYAALAARLARHCRRPGPEPPRRAAPRAAKVGPRSARWTREKPRSVLVPTMQLGSAGLDLESKALAAVLENRGFDALGLATAYVNPPEDVAAALAASDAPVDVLVPSAETHGFGSATGAKRAVPLGHAACARDLAARLGPAGRLREWAGPGTFHGKGVWLFEEGRVAATVLGSSNFNARSRDRDLELGAVLLPRDAGLGRALAAEWRALAADARAPDAAAPPWWLGPLRPLLRPFL